MERLLVGQVAIEDLQQTGDASRIHRLDNQEAAAGDENLMPYLLESVKADATLGEICAALKEVFGTYQEPVVL